jgi:RNA polymerase sigma-70 factor (ECF subfamily)
MDSTTDHSSRINGIIARVLGGDVDAFGEIVRLHQEEIWRLVAFAMLDTATTEDLVQQVFVDAYFHLEQFQRDRDFGKWLRAIARNAVRKELRRAVRESGKYAAYRNHLLERLDESPETDRHEEDLRAALAKCREGLAPDVSRALELRYGESRSFQDIARVLGRTVAASRQLLQRVRLALRKCVEERMAQA